GASTGASTSVHPPIASATTATPRASQVFRVLFLTPVLSCGGQSSQSAVRIGARRGAARVLTWPYGDDRRRLDPAPARERPRARGVDPPRRRRLAGGDAVRAARDRPGRVGRRGGRARAREPVVDGRAVDP